MKSGGGKHWTSTEIEARQKAQAKVTREKKKTINAPASLSKEAKAVWFRILKSVEGLELFDNMDTELLESYCNVVVKKKELENRSMLSVEDTKAYQAYIRLQKSLADSLGLSPAARARLIKKAADKELEDQFGKEFD